MFDAIAPRYDLVNRVMTFGLDVRWRRRSIRELALAPRSVVLDLACGTGDFCRELARHDLRAIGMDLSRGMLAAASTDSPLVETDILRLPVATASVDGITCGFALRNLVDLPTFFDELARVVHPGGRIALLEVAEPDNRVLRSGHHIYFDRVVPWIGGVLSNRDAYRYLPRSVAYLPSPSALVTQLETAGFQKVERTLFAPGAAQLFTATRR